MTFSLVARCARTGMFGVAIASSSPAVAARCAHARAGVGAVASQNVTDPSLGPLGLDLMEEGRDAAEALEALMRHSAFPEYRQVLVVDAHGRSATHSGAAALGIWSDAQAENVAAGGNLLADERVPRAMVENFLATDGHLGDRLILAMRAGLAAGGEAGPVHSAGLKLVDRVSWPVADLRCDWTEACPVEAVARIWDLYEPQMEAYVQRAQDPRDAPAFGVAGDPG